MNGFARIEKSLAKVRSSLRQALEHSDDFALLHALRFERVGCDPLDDSCALNIVEQLNQTTTYLVTLAGVAHLLCKHGPPLRINLGTAAGHDIESPDGSVVAEAFAAASFASNRKLVTDQAKLKGSRALHRYVFYYALKPWKRDEESGVTLIYVPESELRAFLRGDGKTQPLPPLPSFDMREAMVDVADREALYEVMDGPELRRLYGEPTEK